MFHIQHLISMTISTTRWAEEMFSCTVRGRRLRLMKPLAKVTRACKVVTAPAPRLFACTGRPTSLAALLLSSSRPSLTSGCPSSRFLPFCFVTWPKLKCPHQWPWFLPAFWNLCSSRVSNTSTRVYFTRRTSPRFLRSAARERRVCFHRLFFEQLDGPYPFPCSTDCCSESETPCRYSSYPCLPLLCFTDSKQWNYFPLLLLLFSSIINYQVG